jgi:AcrR family transcriptional regulator
VTAAGARARVRAELTREITEAARRHLATHGAVGLSLRAVARELGMASSAVYRYFASRDELLKKLVVDAYGDLAETLGQALERARRRRPDARFRAVADAYRDWALEHPGQYPLLLGGGLARGDQPPEIAIASQRAMEHILFALRDVAADHPRPEVKLPRELDAQLSAWARSRGAGDGLPPWLLRLAIATWQRLHGHIALELEGVHTAMGISSDALYRTEVDAILAEAIEPS